MMVNANDLRSEQVLHRQSLLALILSVVYLCFLIIPWILTCVVASNPRVLIKRDTEYYYDPSETYTIDHKIITAINVLNTLTVVLSLPFLSFLLSRAAVVFSQRRNGMQQLTVRQLFALADHAWWDPISVVTKAKTSVLLKTGWFILALAFVLPFVRSSLISFQSINISPDKDPTNYSLPRTKIGVSPGPGYLQAADSPSTIKAVSTALQMTTGEIASNLWPYCTNPNANYMVNSTCGYSYGPYNMVQSTLSNFWNPGYYSSLGNDQTSE